MEKGLTEARDLIDTKLINNLKSKGKMSRRPYSHSFEAVAVLKKKYESQDKYLIYKMDDGSGLTKLSLLKVLTGTLKY